MGDLQEYKCPNCGGAVEFSSAEQKLKCPYCDSEFEIAAIEEYESEKDIVEADEMDWETQPGSQWEEGETAGLVEYICQSCGGEIVGDETMAATSCPYCDNPVVVKGQFSGDLRPDYVIPFQLDKEAAMAAYQRHVTGKKLLPNLFRSQNRIEEIKGMYVPFWLFDAQADASFSYRATKVRSWSSGEYIYTSTKHFSIKRDGNIAFAKVPVDGSTKMPDDLMESVEPFDFSRAVDFNTAYFAGYLADKYDVSADESVARANQRIKESTEQKIRQTISGYSSVREEKGRIHLKNGQAKYALYPVWILTTKWNNQNFTFAMNGQTGKMVGDLPMDIGKFLKWLVGLTFMWTLIILLIMWFML